MSEDVNEWLECLPWDGDEKSLPVGGRIAIPGLPVSAFAKTVVVLRGDELITVSRKETKPDDVIMDVVVDENMYDTVVRTYGERGITIAPPTGSGSLTRREWKDQYGTDGLKLWILRDLRMKQTGGGVRVGI